MKQGNTRCEAVICLLSKHWEAFVIQPTPALVLLTHRLAYRGREIRVAGAQTVAVAPLSGSVGFLS